MERLEIGICDDDKLAARQLSCLVQQVTEEEKALCNVYNFNSEETLLQKVKTLNLIFLNSEMMGNYGVEIGKKIRRIEENCKIILFSSQINHFKEAFKMQAFRFVTKPFETEEIREIIDTCYNITIGTTTIELFRERKLYRVSQRQIQYIVSYDSYTEYVVKSKKFRQTYSLRQLEAILDLRCFYRVHRQYIVNLYWIQNYKDGIIYIGNTQIVVSRRKRKEFEKVYFEFKMKHTEFE